ncbi:MAG TPA: DUF4105 domain-containing protein [Gemmatimonadaceae bacterium]|nr:DUF4105 domain-containing protein [Gemmatimonadaceae bacterium]
MKSAIAGVALLFCAVRGAQAQSPSTKPAVPGSELTIYLMTMGPGDEAWEKFGHNAIWIHDTLRHTDIAYNWGLFDFNAKDFYPRFLKGDMLYSMGGFDAQETVDAYRQANRTVWAQELNLAPLERDEIRKFIEWNSLPQNRNYNYDYFRDNCSTRVRDVLDRALGGIIRSASEETPTPTSYRWHTRRLTQDASWIYFGTLLGLGHPVDHPITRWEEMFLPVRLMKDIRSINVRDSVGASVPLVKKEMTLFQSTRDPEAPTPSSHLIYYFLLGLILASAVVLLRRRIDADKSGRVGLLLLTGFWNFFIGILGSALAALWLFTNHIYSYRNENLLQANPISLLLAVLLFLSLRRKSDQPMAGVETGRVARIVGALAVIGFVIQILPGFDQVNGEIIALTLPVHLASAFALSRRELPFFQSTRHTSAFVR